MNLVQPNQALRRFSSFAYSFHYQGTGIKLMLQSRMNEVYNYLNALNEFENLPDIDTRYRFN